MSEDIQGPSLDGALWTPVGLLVLLDAGAGSVRDEGAWPLSSDGGLAFTRGLQP